MSWPRRWRRADLAPEDFVRLSKEYAQIEPVAAAAREVRRLRAELEVLTGLAARRQRRARTARKWRPPRPRKSSEKLPEAERALALQAAAAGTPPTTARRCSRFAPAPAATKPLCSPATCLRMYQRFAEEQGWKFELISASRVRRRRL